MANFSEKLKRIGKRFASLFFQGVLLLAPATFTGYVIYKVFDLFDSNTNPFFEKYFHFSFPGLGILVFALFITLFGFIGSTVILQPLLNLIENLLQHTPLVKDIYSSFKDFIAAFVSNKRKFNKPVIVEIGKDSGIFRMGFITDDDLSKFDIHDKVAVYFPQSYTFAGHLYLINKNLITELPASMSADAIKYMLSGGVMEVEEKDKNSL